MWYTGRAWIPLLKYYPSLALLPLSGWSDSQTVTHIWKPWFYCKKRKLALLIFITGKLLQYPWNNNVINNVTSSLLTNETYLFFLKLKTNSGRDMVVLTQSPAVFYTYTRAYVRESALRNIKGHLLSETFTFLSWLCGLGSWHQWDTPQSDAQLSVLPRKSSWWRVGKQRSSKKSFNSD